MGEHAADAIVLQGFDQQLPEGVEPLLPAAVGGSGGRTGGAHAGQTFRCCCRDCAALPGHGRLRAGGSAYRRPRCRRWATVPGCSIPPNNTGSASACWPGELVHPWAIAFMPDGAMLITERPGRLRVVRRGVLDPQPVSGVPEVRTDGNGGLMDVTLHPDFADNGLVYLTYTKTARRRPRLAGPRAGPAGGARAPRRRGTWSFPSHSTPTGDSTDASPSAATARSTCPPGGASCPRTASSSTPRRIPASLRGKVLRLDDDGSAPGRQPVRERAGPSAGDLHDRASQHARPHAASRDRRHLAARERSQRRRRVERPPARAATTAGR